MNTSHLLLDIEGTTCPVSFVSDILFPYASKSLETYLGRSQTNPMIERLLEDAEQEWEEDGTFESKSLRLATKTNAVNRIQAITQYLRHLTAIDRKSTVLKDIQGKIWNEGYSSGNLKSQLFEEAPSCLRRWHANNLTLAVYSSG
ncbi:MAG: acireductone synthase, partial [Synechococcus sp. BS307-5m-G38]|nr:acireductone synthase [Synechococcus sp. BS307-5m-G38]